jgi:hypothetical protein
MPVGRNKVVAQDASGDSKVLKNIAPVELYAVNYIDGGGKESTRIVGRFHKAGKFYFVFPKGSEEGMLTTAPWLHELLVKKIDGATLPQATAGDLPSGDPLQG